MQYELKKCLDQMDMKNDQNSIIPQDILTDINDVFIELARDYYYSCKEDLVNNLKIGGKEELAKVAVDATILLWIRKNILNNEKNDKIDAFNTILDNYEDIIKADSDSKSTIHTYTYDDKSINKAIKKSGLKDVTISLSPIKNWDKKIEDRQEADGRYIYNLRGLDKNINNIIPGKPGVVLEYNMLKKELIYFLNNYQKNKGNNIDGYYKIGFREVRPDTTESTSDNAVSETNSEGHK